MLNVENISYYIGDRQILNAVSFSLMSGNKVALVGANGAGKSTLLKIIVGEIFSDEGEIVKPDRIGYVPQVIIDEPAVIAGVTVRDFMLEGRNLKDLWGKMQTFADAMGSKNQTEEQLKKNLDGYAQAQNDFSFQGGYEAESEIQIICSGIGLTVDLDTEVKFLSGGEKSRLAFARSLFADCDLLILDEPTNHIDRPYYAWLGRYLRQTTKTILVVSHHPEFINPFAQRIIAIEKLTGRLREYQGTYQDYLEQSAIDEKTIIRRLEWLEKEINRLKESALRLQFGGPNKANAAQNMFKRIERLEKQKEELSNNLVIDEETLHFRLFSPTPSGQQVMHGQELKKSFAVRLLFENISFDVFRGDRIVIVGRNGSGKSTLLKIITGSILPDAGRIDFGTNVRIGYYAQEHENLRLDKNVLTEAQSANQKYTGNIRTALARFLFFQDKVFQTVGTLSPGEKSRLSLCKLMVGDNNLLILDEPTNYLDGPTREVVATAVQDYAGTVIVVSHDHEFIKLIKPNRALILPSGLMTDFEEKMLIE